MALPPAALWPQHRHLGLLAATVLSCVLALLKLLLGHCEQNLEKSLTLRVWTSSLAEKNPPLKN